MENKMRILLATDESEAVMNAERYAFQLAAAHKFPLTMMHVEEISKTPGGMRRLEERRAAILNALKMDQEAIHCECVFRHGSVAREIASEALESDADLIVTGTHGKSGFRDIFFGSHTWEVIRSSEVPVLSVPKEALYTGVKQIVFATEYREGEIPVIRYLAKLASTLNAELTVLHVTNYVLSKEFEHELFEQFRNEVQSRVPYAGLRMTVMKGDDLVDGLNEYCTTRKIDWLAMSPAKPFFLGRLFNSAVSATRRMTFHVKVPLLTIPDYYDPRNAAFWKIFQKEADVTEW